MTQLRHFIFNTTTTVTGVTYNGFHVISLKHIETISKSVPHHKDSQRDTTPLNIFFYTIKYPRIGHNWYAKVLRMFLNRLILKLVPLVSGEVELCLGRGAIEGLVRYTQHRPSQGRRRNEKKEMFNKHTHIYIYIYVYVQYIYICMYKVLAHEGPTPVATHLSGH